MTITQEQKFEMLYSIILDDIESLERTKDKQVSEKVQAQIDSAKKEADAIIQELGYTPQYIPADPF